MTTGVLFQRRKCAQPLRQRNGQRGFADGTAEDPDGGDADLDRGQEDRRFVLQRQCRACAGMPSSASFCRRDCREDTTAISDMARTPLSRIRKSRRTMSIAGCDGNGKFSRERRPVGYVMTLPQCCILPESASARVEAIGPLFLALPDQRDKVIAGPIKGHGTPSSAPPARPEAAAKGRGGRCEGISGTQVQALCARIFDAG